MKNLFKNLRSFLQRSFTRANISKILIIFIVGFTSRYLINEYYNINVFTDYLSSISIIFYTAFSAFIVFVHEIFTFFNLNSNYSTIKHMMGRNIKLKDGLIIDKTHGDFRVYDTTGTHYVDRSHGDCRIYDSSQASSSSNLNNYNRPNSNYNYTNMPNTNFMQESYPTPRYISQHTVRTQVNTTYNNGGITNTNFRPYVLQTAWENGQEVNYFVPVRTPDLHQHPAMQRNNYVNPVELMNPQYSTETIDTTRNDTLSRKGKDPVRRHQITKALQQKHGIPTRSAEERSKMFADLANEKFATKEIKMQANIKEGEKLSFNLQYINDNDVQSVYVKYKNIAKRKFYWNIWEAGRGNYSTYEEFKKNFNPNMSIIKEITQTIKANVSKEIRDLLNTNPLRSDKHKAVYNRDFPKIYNPYEFNRVNHLNAKLNKATVIPKDIIENNNTKLSPKDRVRTTRK